MTSSTQELAPARSEAASRHLHHIRELDGVRGVAALMVLFHHVCFTTIDPTGWGSGVVALRSIFYYGESGVDIFFVLSGFLITALLIEGRQTPSYYQDFYWKRALRILPLYLLCLVGVLFFMPGSRNYVVLCALFISNFAWLFRVTTDGPFWTLAIEEQFYLIWPTVVRRRSVRQLRYLALCIGVTTIGLRLAAACFGHFNYHFTFFRCDALAFGAFLACWFCERDSFQANSRREDFAICFSLVAGLVMIAMSFFPTTSLQHLAFAAAALKTGVTFVSGSIIAYLISHAGQRNLAWLRSPGITFFGLISYGIYMLNMYVMFCYDHLFGALPVGNNFAYAVRVVTIFTTTIVLCVVSRYLIELPATSLRKYVLAKPSTR